MSATRHVAGRPSRHTVRAGRLRLARSAGVKVYTYSSPFDPLRTVRRAGATTIRKER